MAERRSLGQAINLTPEKMAFIQGQEKKGSGSTAKQSEPKTIDLGKTEQEEVADLPRKRPTRRTRARGANTGTPNADEILEQVLVPVTIRLQRGTAQALKRAYLEQQLRHAKPHTQQEIVEEAVSDWLFKQGFLY